MKCKKARKNRLDKGVEKEIHIQMRNAAKTMKLMTTKRQPETNCNNVESLS
jgi:hypothetical protein